MRVPQRVELADASSAEIRQARRAVSMIAVTLVIATVSRVFVAAGAPSVIDFIHIPLVFCAVGLASQAIRRCRICRRGFWWLGVLFVVSVISWIDSGGELARPIAEWVLLAEPLLLVMVLIGAAASMPAREASGAVHRIEFVVITLACVQFPFAMVETIQSGVGDHVQGTFLGVGSGAHIAAALAVVGAIACLGKAILTRTNVPRWIAIAIGLLSLTVLCDAKQVIIAVAPALVVLFLVSDLAPGRSAAIRKGNRTAVIAIAAAVFAAVFMFYAPFHQSQHSLSTQKWNGKLIALNIVGRAMAERPETYLVGLGPGNTVGKLAILTEGSGLRSTSPVAFLNLRQSPVTAEVLALDKSNYVIASSSVWSGLSSDVGLFGDLGALGVLAYLMAWWALLRGTQKAHSVDRAIVTALVILALVLGYLFIWLEEPNIMLPLAALAAGGVIRGQATQRAQKTS